MQSKAQATNMDSFEKYITPEFLTGLFKNKISHKKSKGIDKISPVGYYSRLKSEIDTIIRKTSNGSYTFSPYLENLKIKSKDKFPRVLSIPTVRDRILLATINTYLQDNYSTYNHFKLANNHIKDLGEYISQTTGKLYYAKADIEAYYDNIVHDKLSNVLYSFGVEEFVIELIDKAIKTPTLNRNFRKSERAENSNAKGVPQGLSISNILAQFYLYGIDQKFQELQSAIYVRYVDDIILLSTANDAHRFIDSLTNDLSELGLKLNPEKTEYGELNDLGINHLGYHLSRNNITIATKNIEKFLTGISSKFTWIKNCKEKPSSRPSWMYGKDSLLENQFLDELNERITGAIAERRYYGWVHYFREISDITVLFKIDAIIEQMFDKYNKYYPSISKTSLKKISRAYYEGKKSKTKYIRNYEMKTLAEKRDFLVLRGKIDPTLPYDELYIEDMFERWSRHSLSQLERDAKGVNTYL